MSERAYTHCSSGTSCRIHFKAISRTLSPGQAWQVELPASASRVREIRRHFRADHRLCAEFYAQLDVNAGPGPARCVQSASSAVVP